MKRKFFNQSPTSYAQAILEAQRKRAARNPAHAAKLFRMHECISSWMAHQLEGPTPAKSHSHRHCKSKSCVPCWERRISELTADVVDACKKATSDDVRPAFLTFSGPAFPFPDAARCVDDAISHWSRFAGSRYGQHLLEGYVRGVEIDLDHDALTVNASVSAIVMVNDLSRVANFGGWLELWNRYAQAEDWQLTYHETPNTRTIHADISLRAFAQRVGTYAVRPENLCEEQEAKIICDADKLETIDGAITGRRFICFGGSMSA